MHNLFFLITVLLLSGCSGTTVKLEAPDKPINIQVKVDIEDHTAKPMASKP